MSFVFEVGKLVFDIEGFMDDLKIYDLAKYNISKCDQHSHCMQKPLLGFHPKCV